tara:strand:- start:1886 stop:2068 length:183 start_codon:yes stop_codon:yes gene_type:complete
MPLRFMEEIPALPELREPEDVDAVVVPWMEGSVAANSAMLPGTSASSSGPPRTEIGVGES